MSGITRNQLICLGFAWLILTVAVSARLFLENSTSSPRQPQVKDVKLEGVFSACSVPGRVDDLPTEAVRVELGANEIVHKRFSSRQALFEVYVAHWSPGNQYAFEAMVHPPELCWPNSGWRCTESRSNNQLGSNFKSGEWRRFAASTQDEQEVVFWCMLGETPIPMGFQERPPQKGVRELMYNSRFVCYWSAVLRQARDELEDKRGEQLVRENRLTEVYFVRINTPFDLGTVMKSEAFSALAPFFRHVKIIK